MRRDRRVDRILAAITEYNTVLLRSLGGGSQEAAISTKIARLRLVAAIDGTVKDLPRCRRLADDGETNLTSDPDFIAERMAEAIEEVMTTMNLDRTARIREWARTR